MILVNVRYITSGTEYFRNSIMIKLCEARSKRSYCEDYEDSYKASRDEVEKAGAGKVKQPRHLKPYVID